MEQIITFSELNDFVFCPMSLYYHSYYQGLEKNTYQTTDQIEGTHAHAAVDAHRYSTRKTVLQGLSVYSDAYRLQGKIDIYYSTEKKLVERKRSIVNIYDGYIFQLYGQYFGMKEAGFKVEQLALYSMTDHKTYPVNLPEQDPAMSEKFEALLDSMRDFKPESFSQPNPKKCERCIYSPLCGEDALC